MSCQSRARIQNGPRWGVRRNASCLRTGGKWAYCLSFRRRVWCAPYLQGGGGASTAYPLGSAPETTGIYFFVYGVLCNTSNKPIGYSAVLWNKFIEDSDRFRLGMSDPVRPCLHSNDAACKLALVPILINVSYFHSFTTAFTTYMNFVAISLSLSLTLFLSSCGRRSPTRSLFSPSVQRPGRSAGLWDVRGCASMCGWRGSLRAPQHLSREERLLQEHV